MIKATTIIEDEFWILKDQNQKVGEITVEQDGSYSLKIKGKIQATKSNIQELRDIAGVEFDDITPQVVSLHSKTNIYGFPTDSTAYNPVYDVKRRIALYTKSPKSRSWHAAGYFKIKQYEDWELVFCPKLIILDRYDHFGPAKSADGFEFK